MFKNRNISIILGVLAIFFLAIFLGDKNKDSLAQLKIDYQNEKARVFSGEVLKDMTIFDAMVSVSNAGGIEFKREIKKNKVDILFDKLSISQILLNKVPIASEKIETTKIRAGDKIEIKLD